jgi:hypothetical protein
LIVVFGGDWFEIMMLDAMKRDRNDVNCSGYVPVEKENGEPL